EKPFSKEKHGGDDIAQHELPPGSGVQRKSGTSGPSLGKGEAAGSASSAANPSTWNVRIGSGLPLTSAAGMGLRRNRSSRAARISSVISRSTWNLLVSPSTREATLTGSPETWNLKRPPAPMTPATTSPLWMPTPKRNSG